MGWNCWRSRPSGRRQASQRRASQGQPQCRATRRSRTRFVINLTEDGSVRRFVENTQGELYALTEMSSEVCASEALHDTQRFLGRGA
eukprot:6987355-Lingulodinium_polyedra.AAC.1